MLYIFSPDADSENEENDFDQINPITPLTPNDILDDDQENSNPKDDFSPSGKSYILIILYFLDFFPLQLE